MTPVSPLPPVFPEVVVVVGGNVVVVAVVVGGTVVGGGTVGVVVVRVIVVRVVVVRVVVVVGVVTGTVVVGAASRIGVNGAGAELAVVPCVVVAALVVGCVELVSTFSREPLDNETPGAVTVGAVVVEVDGTTAVVVVSTCGMNSWFTGAAGSANVGSDAGCRERAANINAASTHPTKASVMLRALCGLSSGHG